MEQSKGKLKVEKDTELFYPHDSYLVTDENGNSIVNFIGDNPDIDAEANALHLIKCWNAFEKDGLVGEMRDALKDALKDMDSDAVQCNGDWQTGLFCGLEDVGTNDIYEACLHGYEKALDKVQEWVLCNFEAVLAKYEEIDNG
jgi:hypothetical protein